MKALAPWQIALVARLNDYPGLQGYQHASMVSPGPPRVGVSTFDAVPSGTRPPYMRVEGHTATPFGVFGGGGEDDTTQLGIWDNYPGGKGRVLEIAALVDAALEEPVPVPGYQPFRAVAEFFEVLSDPSGMTHGVLRLRKLNVT